MSLMDQIKPGHGAGRTTDRFPKKIGKSEEEDPSQHPLR